ncbi:MAG: hypothetical protein KBA46_03745 [Candidatus Omnitrophica bacterium]|nr:hypothetical protein [Candidatus Omnitrophota bacterium]
MKRWQLMFLIAIVLIPAHLLGKSGNPIPASRISIIEAITIAQAHFSEETRLIDQDYVKKSEYVLVCAEYTNRFNEDIEPVWAWKIRFVHPIYNDHSLVYKVTNDRQVIFIAASE